VDVARVEAAAQVEVAAIRKLPVQQLRIDLGGIARRVETSACTSISLSLEG
jgi:hypothetical protein